MKDYPFIGNAYCALDAMGRMTLPGFVRCALARRSDARIIFVGRHDVDRCLISYDRGFALGLSEDIRRRRLAEEERAPEMHHARARRAFGFVDELLLDTRGKVILPPLLRRVAGLERAALVVGAGGTFEIWSPEIALESADRAIAEIAAFHLDHDLAA